MRLDNDKITDKMDEEIEKAVQALKEGKTMLYPTDTIWGIGCDATDRQAVEKVFALKKRPDSKSLIVLVSDESMLEEYVEEVPQIAYSLIEVNDKPMTIIYPKGKGLAENLLAEDGSVGIRIPKSDFCIRLIKRFRKPIVSTSANISGEKAPSRHAEISEEITNGADFCVNPAFEGTSSHKASSIIKLGINGEIEIIRK